MLFVLLLLLPGMKTEESTSINYGTYKNLPFDAVKFLKQVRPTKKGPVLFPNDGPTPPPTPLIVTSRPLIESIRRSELNPNNTVQASSQLNQVTYRPEYLGSDLSSKPYSYSPTAAPLYEFVRVPYVEVPVRRLTGSKALDDYVGRNSHSPLVYRGSSDNTILSEPKNPILEGVKFPDYEYKDASSDFRHIYRNKPTNGDDRQFYTQQRSTLPSIYSAFSDHANDVLTRQKPQAHEKPVYEYQNPSPDYRNYNPNKGIVQGTEGDHNYGENYAFSYTVKDHTTGDDFSHSQSSSGSATNGEYRVRLPDGRMQIVSYTADERGYKADVRYDDFEDSSENNKPATKEQPYDDFDYHYPNNRYALNSSERLNNNNNANSHDDPTGGNLYVDYIDNNKKSYINYNNDKLPGNLYENNNINKLYQNDNAPYNNDINGDAYNEKLFQPNVDYDSYEEKDYSSEHVNYQPYKSKYSAYTVSSTQTPNAVTSTVVPPYEELKQLFVTQNPVFGSVNPQESKADRVVVIGTRKPTIFTNIKKLITDTSVSPNPIYYSTTPVPTTTSPSSYLYSTITNLKNKLSLSVKPILSQEYLNKINKYLDLKL